jgi:hypothetical protein
LLISEEVSLIPRTYEKRRRRTIAGRRGNPREEHAPGAMAEDGVPPARRRVRAQPSAAADASENIRRVRIYGRVRIYTDTRRVRIYNRRVRIYNRRVRIYKKDASGYTNNDASGYTRTPI